jgi:glycosyltransferase involved in cell wall biosynthesis
MKKVVVIAPQYPNDIRIYKEVNTLKNRYNIHIFLTDTRKTDPPIELLNEVAIHRFKHQPSSNKVLKYVRSFFRYLRMTRAAIADSPHICHVHDFPLLFSGILVKLYTGSTLIYDAHEDFASMIFQNDAGKIAIFRKIELLLVRLFVDRVITVNKSLQSFFLQSTVGTHILMNVPLLSIHEEKKGKLHSKKITIGYIGHIIPGRGYRTLIPLCNQLKDILPLNILIVGGGPFKEGFEALIRENTIDDYFTITGEVPHDTMPEYLKQMDIGLVLFKPVRYNNIIATPNKLFEYMAFGIPIVASDLPEMRRIIQNTQSGLLVDPCRIEDIVKGIVYLYEHPEQAREMGRNGKKAFQTTYNWDAQSEELIRLYAEIAN